jgi:capsular polysaccharide biosynthesis protein
LSDQDPRLVFADADVIVGAHGSALADLVFCQPGTSVLELVPTDHVYPYWYCASVAAQLKYSYLACRSTSHRPPDALGPSPYDFTVDLAELSTALDHLLESATAR